MTDLPRSQQPGEAAWRAIDPYRERVDIFFEPDELLSDFKAVPAAVGHLLAVWWCNSEVCNGGFHQFFSNSAGILAPEALAGYRSIGSVHCSELVESAIRMFGSDFPRDRDSRFARLSELEGPGDRREDWDPFYLLDDKYYAAKRMENLFAMMDQYALETAGLTNG